MMVDAEAVELVASTNSFIASGIPFLRRTSIFRLDRSRDSWDTNGSRSLRFCRISVRTLGVAVAVNPIKGTCERIG